MTSLLGHSDPPDTAVRCRTASQRTVPLRSHRLLRVLACLALSVAVVPLVAIGPIGPIGSATPVQAQSDGNGLEESSTNTFRIDQTTGTVQVTVEISLRNVTADQREGDVIRQTFFTAYGVIVPVGAENVVATRDGSTLSGELVVSEDGEAFSLYQFDLGTRLFNGESTAIVVTYDHTGQPPRSELLWRVNAAYASFLAFGLGDSGAITVDIVLPSGYEFDEFTDLEGFVAGAPDEFGGTTYTRSGLDEDFSTIVSLSNDALLTSTQLDVPGADLELRSWPDDPEWTAFATEKVETGIPELEQLIGVPWPLDQAFDIRETVEPNFLGYAGWFDTQASEIAVGEELDAVTLYHELSHAWFNRDVFSSRWLSEGLAELYAAEMVERDGDPRPIPNTPPLSGLGRQPLSQWTNFSADDNTEEYGYNAAHFVMDAVAADIGFDAMADVLEAVRNRQIAYPAIPPTGATPGEPDQRSSDIIDWRRMLDYFEFVGGSTVADGVFREYVAADSDLVELADREVAIASYEQLAEQVAPWSMPAGIRERMDLWAFERASALQQEATDVLGLRSTVDELAIATGISPTSAVMEDAAAAFAAADDDFELVTSALESERSAGQALADQQTTIADLADTAETTPPTLDTLRGIDGFASARPFADDQIDALVAIIDVAAAEAAPRSLTEQIGLWGSDVDVDLEAARKAVESGDNDVARMRATDASRTLDEAGSVGSSRLATAVAALAALLALLIALIVLARRRRNRAASTAVTYRTGSGSRRVPSAVAGVVTGEFGHRDVDLDEDALTGAGLGGVHDVGDVALADPGEAARATGVVERSPVLRDVGDPVFQLDEHVGTVIDTDPVTGAEVLVDPHSHDEYER